MLSGRRKRVKPTDRIPSGGSEKSKDAEACLICDVIIMTGMIPMMLFTVREIIKGGSIGNV